MSSIRNNIKHLNNYFPQVPFPTSSSFIQEVETALESFDFLNYSDVDEEEEEEIVKDEDKKHCEQDEKEGEEDRNGQHKEVEHKVEEEEGEEKDESNFYSGERSVLNHRIFTDIDGGFP